MLSATSPQGNMGEVIDKSPDTLAGPKKNRNGFRCHECNSEYHLRDTYPQRKKKLADKEGKDKCDKKPAGNFKQKMNTDWKFIAPADENATITVNGLEYFYYKHCI